MPPPGRLVVGSKKEERAKDKKRRRASPSPPRKVKSESTETTSESHDREAGAAADRPGSSRAAAGATDESDGSNVSGQPSVLRGGWYTDLYNEVFDMVTNHSLGPDPPPAAVGAAWFDRDTYRKEAMGHEYLSALSALRDWLASCHDDLPLLKNVIRDFGYRPGDVSEKAGFGRRPGARWVGGRAAAAGASPGPRGGMGPIPVGSELVPDPGVRPPTAPAPRGPGEFREPRFPGAPWAPPKPSGIG